MKEYTLHSTWHTPHAQPAPERKPRATRNGPHREHALLREGAWPEFIPRAQYKGPKREPRPKPVLTDEEQRAVWRARAKAYYNKMTPEQRAAKRAAHAAFLRAHPEKRREYNARYNSKHRKEPKTPIEGRDAHGRFVKGHTKPPGAGGTHRPPHGPDGRFIKHNI